MNAYHDDPADMSVVSVSVSGLGHDGVWEPRICDAAVHESLYETWEEAMEAFEAITQTPDTEFGLACHDADADDAYVAIALHVRMGSVDTVDYIPERYQNVIIWDATAA